MHAQEHGVQSSPAASSAPGALSYLADPDAAIFHIFGDHHQPKPWKANPQGSTADQVARLKSIWGSRGFFLSLPGMQPAAARAQQSPIPSLMGSCKDQSPMPKLIRRPPIRYLGMNSTDPAIVVQQLFSDRQFPGVGGYTRQVDGHNGWQGGRRGVDETGPSHDMESESWGDHRASAIENPFRKLQALQE